MTESESFRQYIENNFEVDNEGQLIILEYHSRSAKGSRLEAEERGKREKLIAEELARGNRWKRYQEILRDIRGGGPSFPFDWDEFHRFRQRIWSVNFLPEAT